MNRLLGFFLLASFTFLTGCVSAPPRASVQAHKADVILFLFDQQEIEVNKPDVNGGGGLLGAIIEGVMESNMDKNRQEAIQPVRDSVADFTFETKYVESIRSAIPASMLRDDVVVEIARSPEEAKTLRAKHRGKKAISLSTHYGFEQDFRCLYLLTLAHFVQLPNNPDDKAEVKKLKPYNYGFYISEFAHPSAYAGAKYSDGGFGKFKLYAPHWAGNQGQAIRTALDRAVVEHHELIKTDFLNPPTYPAKGKTKFLPGFTMPLYARKGTVVKTEVGRTMLYSKLGAEQMFWMDQSQIKQ